MAVCSQELPEHVESSLLPCRRLHERKLVRVVDVVVLKLYAATSANQRTLK